MLVGDLNISALGLKYILFAGCYFYVGIFDDSVLSPKFIYNCGRVICFTL